MTSFFMKNRLSSIANPAGEPSTNKACRTGRFLLDVTITCCLVVGVFAPDRDIFAVGSIGTSGADFLDLGTSTRALSMGEAFTAMAEDMNAVYYNPAVAATLSYREASFQHQELIEDSRLEHIAFSYPIKYGADYYGNLYVGQTLFWVPPFEKIDINGESDGDVVFLNSSTAIGYGYRIGRFYSGATVKYIYQHIDSLNVSSAAVDLGLLGGFTIPSPFSTVQENLLLGISFLNLGTNAMDDPLPRKARIGASYLPIDWARVNLDFYESLIDSSDVYDFTYGFDESFGINSGVEFTYMNLLSFRAGYRFNDAGGYTFGAGVNYAIGKTAFTIDASLCDTVEFGPVFSVQVGVMLVPKITTYDISMAEKYYLEGIKYYVEDDLDSSIISLKKARQYNPYYRDIDKKIKELEELKKLRRENLNYDIE